MKQLALLPVAPLRFTIWLARSLAEHVDQELSSPQAILRRLQEIDEARARGELDEEQAAELEVEVLAQAGRELGHHG